MKASELARIARTLRWLRPRQMVGQVRHRLRRGEGPAVALPERAPSLAAPAHALRFLGPPAADRYVRRSDADVFELLHRRLVFRDAIDWNDLEHGLLVAFHLHQFHYLRDPSLEAATRARLVVDWIERHPEGIGWKPDPTSFRILNWTRCLLSPGTLPGDPALRARVARSLTQQAETLARRIEVHVDANHLFSNLASLVFVGLAFEGARADDWLRHEGAFRRELEAQIGRGGAHYERSPMYHAVLFETVLDLLQIARARPERAPAALTGQLEEKARAMAAALRFFTLPDGRISLLADSAFGFSAEPDALLDHAARLGVAGAPEAPTGVLADAGYVRLAAGEFVLIASVAGPGPSFQPGHAHADALAFELAAGAERLVTDTGVCEYVPGPLREASRATRSHATIEVGERDQAELWSSFRIGGRPEVGLVGCDGSREARAWCTGWATPRTRHERRFRLDPEGLTIDDRVEGPPESLRHTLPVAPGVEVALDDRRARLRTPSGACFVVELPEGLRWGCEDGPYLPEFGRSETRRMLVGRGRAPFRGQLRLRRERAPEAG